MSCSTEKALPVYLVRVLAVVLSLQGLNAKAIAQSISATPDGTGTIINHNFLMNPAGWVFSSGASLDVPGSFGITTATRLGFGDSYFNAYGENIYSNLTGEPTSLIFDQTNPSWIDNGNNLIGVDSQTLFTTSTLVGSIATPLDPKLAPELQSRPDFTVFPPDRWLRPVDIHYLAQTVDLIEPQFHPLSSRWGARFQTGTELGDGTAFGELYSFIPFGQIPGSSTFFFEGQVRLFSNNESYAGNAKVGYRQYIPSADLVWGSYVGFDNRQTDLDSHFWQLGLGTEVLTKNWEGRLNAYLPIGENRSQTSSSNTGITSPATNFRFTGNQLLYDFSTFRQQIRRYEAAASGFDLEGGLTLTNWLNGSLKGYLGTYFLDIPSERAYLGVRGRLTAQLNETLSMGVSVSRDENFGTNVSFQVSAILGGSKGTVSNSLAQRMSRPVQRRSSIAVDAQEEIETTRSTLTVVAINPTTGAEYRFIHVTDGATGGIGTVESPFGEVTDATAIVASAGNDVIYVEAGNRSGLNGFTVPENVRTLSTGVSQSLDIEGLGVTQLPGSGTGTLPLINGATTVPVNGFDAMVGMSDNSTLSGFEIQANVRGVLASNVTGVTIEHNQIATTDQDAIYLDADNGTLSNVTISGNTLSTSGNGDDGITARATNSGTISNMTISDNTMSTSGNATASIFLSAVNSGVISNATISGNTLSAKGSNAPPIYSRSAAGTTSNVTISGNTISTSGANSDGIRIRANNGASSSIRLVDNFIEQAGRHSVFIRTNANPANTICIAQFTGNTSQMPNVFGGGGNDLNLTIGGGTVSFVDFANITTNNIGFDDISGTPTVTPTSC